MVVRCISAGLLITLFLSVDLSVSWVVHMPPSPLHAKANSSIVIQCSYEFPEASSTGPHYKVLSEMWCLGQSHCITQRYVYHSAGIFPEMAYLGRVEYLGTLGSQNCSLRISKLRVSDSGIYVFRFITDHPNAKLPGQRGIKLEVTDTERAQRSNGNLVVWIFGLLLATTVSALAVLCLIRRTRERSQQTISMNMT